MSTAVINNRPKLPSGYRRYPTGPIAGYKAFNGFIGAQNPAVSQFGPTLQFTVNSVPADLSLLTFTGPDGHIYNFQFVYNASVWAAGIKIPLPASGASTAAQVLTAMLTVMQAVSAVDFGGNTILFPWIAAQLAAQVMALNWTVAGTVSLSASPGTIVSALTGFGYGAAEVVPGKFGPNFAFLPLV